MTDEKNLFPVSTASLRKFLRESEKKLREKRFPDENHVFERAILSLKSEAGRNFILSSDGRTAFLGGKIAALDEITTETTAELITRLSGNVYISNGEFEALIWQCRYALILDAAENASDMNARGYLKKMYALGELETRRLNSELNPLEQAFREDYVYSASSEETRALCRRKVTEISHATGIEEKRLTHEYVSRADRLDIDVMTLVYDDFRKVFPFARARRYFWWTLIAGKLLSYLVTFGCGWLWTVLTYLPCIAIVKTAADRIVTATVRNGGLAPRLQLSEIPPEAKTVCVLSALITDGKSAADAADRLRRAKINNPSANLCFALLCDLPAGENEKTESDEALLSELFALQRKNPFMSVFVRHRTYSRTMRKWQGRDRKRGAIEELVNYISGGENTFRKLYGGEETVGAEFIAALDYDTTPLMDGIRELVAIALHPLNSRYGIIAPRISSTLSSTLKTSFAGIMGGNGGVSGVSAYDAASSELYADCFGEGTFTGKGLIRVSAFKKLVCGRFPEERVLSHDILEGGILRVLYAGDVEFTDSFPSSSNAYIKRLHRWIRGDIQNLRFLFRKEFSPLTRAKLFFSVCRGITPLLIMTLLFGACFAKNGWLLLLTALAALFSPYIPSLLHVLFSGLGSARRQFYSPIKSEAKQLLLRCLFELFLLPKYALVSLCAAAATLWRMLISKRNLLCWTTSGMLEKAGGFAHLLPSFAMSLILLMCAILGGSSEMTVTAVIICAGFPSVVCADGHFNRPRRSYVSEKMRTELLELSREMFGFYRDFVSAETSFLPPDNVQFSPVYRVCPRTSPTNIGMYLLSCLCAAEMKIIGREEFLRRTGETLETVGKMQKWNGNLFNWYDCKTLETVSPFVSTVDSGNFVCCLTAVREGLKQYGAQPLLIAAAEKIISKTDLRPFFNNQKKLFSVGFDTDEGKLSPHCYDLLMSEARMTSYYAVADGQADKSHWRALGRTMSRCGQYAGPLAWTGTMFEFFMPELLLKSKEGSMSFEALEYALYCQKRRHTPYGISESAYCGFDSGLNYQYKAHGVQKIGLKAGLGEECVVSPYSSFLTLSADCASAYNNLVKLEKAGCRGKYGFYEAIDYTRWRVSEPTVIKSVMAHHIGMSIAGTANALCEKTAADYFLSDERMARGEELMEERVMAGEKILNITEQKYEKPRYEAENELISEPDIAAPKINVLSNGRLSVFTADNGICTGIYDGKQTVERTHDLLRRPTGELFAFVENDVIMPLVNHPYLRCPAKFSAKTVFSAGETRMTLCGDELELTESVRLFGDESAELRDFSAENNGKTKRQLTLCVYMRFVLADDRDFSAHPAFLDLFLREEFDQKENLFIIRRKERHSERVTVCAVGFAGSENFTYSFNREEVLSFNKPFSFFDKGTERTTSDVSVPAPCLFIKSDFPLDAGEKRTSRLFACYGGSVDEVKAAARKIRSEKAGQSALNPLTPNTLHGRMSGRALAAVLFGAPVSEKIREARSSAENVGELSRLGVEKLDSTLLFDCAAGTSSLKSAVLTKHGMCLCGIPTQLIVLAENALQKELCEQVRGELAGAERNVVVLDKSRLSPQEQTALTAVCCDIISDDAEKPRPEGKYLPLLPCREGKAPLPDGFSDGFYTVSEKNYPHCNILAGENFGTLLSQSALGFTWAENSRENKLTPWFNDVRHDNDGELLLLKNRSGFHDAVNGSKAVFGVNTADYYSKIGRISLKTSVRADGFAKEITVTLTNDGGADCGFDLIYYCEPLLGAEKSGFTRCVAEKNVLRVQNPPNLFFKGEMTLKTDRDSRFVTEKLPFWRGDFSERGDGLCEIAAAVVPLRLPPKKREIIRFILGWQSENADAGTGFSPQNVIRVETPDITVNELINTWLPWQALGARMWAKTGFYQNGGAFGFRDQLQDSLAVMYFMPSQCRRQIIRCCESQFREGDVLHWWHVLGNVKKGVRTRYSDDLLWLPYAACIYSEFSGDTGLWQTETPFVQGDVLADNEHERFFEVQTDPAHESVYLHCKKAMEKAFVKGRNGLLKIGCGDWNDSFNNVGIGGEGESVWLSMFYLMCGRLFARAARKNGDPAYAEKLEKRLAELAGKIEENAWDGEYYLRAFYDDGSKMGSSDNDLCRIDLLPQAFAVLGELPDVTKNLTAINSAINNLVDYKNGIIRLFTPAFDAEKSAQRPGYVMSYPEGVRENGGQYTHAAVWLAIACFRLGQDKRGLELTELLNPAKRGKSFRNEPYFMSADIYTSSLCYGRGGWSVYTGAAGWYYRLLLEEVFGMKITGGKTVAFSPKLPREWDGAKAEMTLFGTKLSLVFRSGGGAENPEIPLDGEEFSGEIYF